MAKYKKSDLIEHIAQKISLSKKQSEDIMDCVLEYITDVLKKGDELTFTGFGSFSAKMRKGRIGINPKNPSQSVNIPPSIVARFKAGKGLKDTLNNK